MSRLLTGLILAATLGFLVAACAPAAAPPAAEVEKKPERAVLKMGTQEFYGPSLPKEEPKYGGKLVYALSGYDPPHLDPHQTLIGAFHGYPGTAYGTLLRFKTGPEVPPLDFIIIPDMAERWEQPNDRTYIFHLKKGIKWQNIPPVNGREFTADDVVYSVERMRTPGFVNASLWVDLTSIEALDRYTVKMVTKEPVVAFLSNVASGYAKMVAKEAVEAGGGNLKNGPTIGTGAFILEKFEMKVGTTLRRNPDFYEPGLPYLDTIKYIQIPDASTRWAAFRSKKVVSGSGASPMENEAFLKQNPDAYAYDSINYYGPQLGMDASRPPFNDVRVRTAVSKAINRKEIRDTVDFGNGWWVMPWLSPLPGVDWLLPQNELDEAYKQDIPLAKKLLAEAGYPNGFEVEFTVASGYDKYQQYAEMTQSYLKEVGIKANLKLIDQPTYTERIIGPGGKYEMFTGPISPPAEIDQALKQWWHSKGARKGNGIYDPKLDQMIEEQGRTFDPEKRKKLVLDIQRYLLQQNYHLTLHGTVTRPSSPTWNCLKNATWQTDYPSYGRAYRSYWIDPGPVCPPSAD